MSSTLSSRVHDVEAALKEAKRWAAEDAEAEADFREALKERYKRARRDGETQGDAELIAKASCRVELERHLVAQRMFKVALKEIDARRTILSAAQSHLKTQGATLKI